MKEVKKRHRIPVQTIKALSDIGELLGAEMMSVTDTEMMDWNQAKEAIKKDKQCVRRTSWPEGKFLWYNPGRYKQVYADAPEGTFHTPISHEFLVKRGIKKMVIGGHYNMWENRPGKEGTIHVGIMIDSRDKKATDWEIYVP